MEVAGAAPVPKFQEYVAAKVELFTKFTVKGVQPESGLATKFATGVGRTVTVCVTVDGPQNPLTVRLTV